jgi:hypothetical protein
MINWLGVKSVLCCIREQMEKILVELYKAMALRQQVEVGELKY